MKANDLGPLVKLDQERCILCTRCVRFTRNVTQTGEIVVFNRGHASEIAIHGDKSFDNPYSGNVVDICPVGALTSSDFRFKVRSWFLKGTSSVCGGCSTGCNLRIDHSARATGWRHSRDSPQPKAQIYRTVGRRNVDVNKSWLCDEGRLSFHTMERWPRLQSRNSWRSTDRRCTASHRFISDSKSIREEHGGIAVAALGSATNTNEALFLMKKYFKGQVDFRLGNEVETYQQRQDDLLRRLDKHPNTQGALDLGLAGEPRIGVAWTAEAGRDASRSAACGFHFIRNWSAKMRRKSSANSQQLIGALDFCVVSTTHEFPWTAGATFVLPMAAWAEETGTYTNYAGRVQITQPRGAAPGRSAAAARHDVDDCWDCPAFRFRRIRRQYSNGSRAKCRPTPAWTTTRIGALGMPGVYAPQQEVVR